MLNVTSQNIPQEPQMIQVLEVSQWEASSVEGMTMEQAMQNQITGGDAASAQELGIAGKEIKQVDPRMKPPWATMWYIIDSQTGKLKFFKDNRDSS